MLKKIFLLFAAILSLFSFSTCSKQSDNEIIVGSVLPLTGPVASYGINAKSGLEIAFDEINSQSPLKINVLYQDDAGNATNAVNATQKLITTDGVPVIIGEAASGLSMAIAPVCNQNKVVCFSPISSASELTEKGGEYFFRVCPSDAFQARILAKWLLDKNIKLVSLLFINNSWGSSLKDEFVTFYAKGGGKINTTEACKEGDRDFKTQIPKMMKYNPQAMVAFTYGKEGGPFLKQAREFGVKLPIYGGDVWGSPELIETAGKAADGVYFTFPASPSGEKFQKFARKFKERFNKEPDIYASYSYDLAYVLSNAFKSGARTGDEIKNYLLKMPPFIGITGVTQFDKNGDVVTKTFEKKTISKGKYVTFN